MKDNFYAIGYHGTDKKYVQDILSKIDYSYNKGDKFLGQGLYLWRDSYTRAVVWAKDTKKFKDLSIIAFKIECEKENVLNFTSTSWNMEEELIGIWQEIFNNLSFGEFLDEMIYNNDMSIDIIVIIDLTKTPNTFHIKDGKSETHFACGDVQICLKNNKPILHYGEV